MLDPPTRRSSAAARARGVGATAVMGAGEARREAREQDHWLLLEMVCLEAAAWSPASRWTVTCSNQTWRGACSLRWKLARAPT
jgi:hypothetical protein